MDMKQCDVCSKSTPDHASRAFDYKSVRGWLHVEIKPLDPYEKREVSADVCSVTCAASWLRKLDMLQVSL